MPSGTETREAPSGSSGASWIKICGITRPEDAEVAVVEGANAIGLVFVDVSPRRVMPAAAAEIARSSRGHVARVGLFVDADAATVWKTLEQVELDLLQFHGEESASFCRSFGVPYIKALPVRGPIPDSVLRGYPDAYALLLDAWVAGRSGGTGHSFDWSLWPSSIIGDNGLPRLILAGGLTPENVAEAVARLAPWGVDVSGGVEGPAKGIKDHERIRRFVRCARHAAHTYP
jgi:phosphoribosylanthranilate isomerase